MQAIDSITQIADRFDAIVFDQWGVLHNGTAPYPQAVATICALQAQGVAMAVLSNSGKRADLNAARIAAMGFPMEAFAQVMTSGEALWIDLARGSLGHIGAVHAITAAAGDAEVWRGDLALRLTDAEAADAILLMGLPDGADLTQTQALLERARAQAKPVLCSNPDTASPRAGGVTVVSPGSLARAYHAAGGTVVYYGKPYPLVFGALAQAMGLGTPARILMVGDSPEHDIAGARACGWQSLFIRGGLHAQHEGPVQDLFAPGAAPDFILAELV
jgi:HAD superfamily hydrolase (TIGR01459 family)